MISRNRQYEKLKPSKDAHKVYIICEGTENGTEPTYFRFFEGLSTNLNIIPIPSSKSIGNDPLKLKEYAERLFLKEDSRYVIDALHRDTVWFVIDTDRWEIEGKITPLRDFCKRHNDGIKKKFDEVKPYSAWNVAQSNPCFEIWHYYHRFEQKPKDKDVKHHSSFKEFVNASFQGGFNPEKDPVNLEQAIHTSQNLYSLNSEGKPDVYTTEMFLLGKEIFPFVKKHLARLREKV